jgi:hypothetical protein
MKQAEPPSTVPCARSLQFLIGKDSRGNWVVQDERGLCGGLFVDRTEALKFAMFENGNHPQAVIMVPGVFELDIAGKTAHRPPLNTNTPRARQAA